MTSVTPDNHSELSAIAAGYIEHVHEAMERIVDKYSITDPTRYALPVMIDQSPDTEKRFHFRIGLTLLGSRLALRETSVVIPLAISSFEVTPKHKLVAQNNRSMRIGGDNLRQTALFVGAQVTDRIWGYIARAPRDGQVKQVLLQASTLIDLAKLEAEERELIPIS